MQQRLSTLGPDPLAFAHRGARAHAAENTMEAFALALKLGANGLETDAWMTKDGHVVLVHDGVLGRRPFRRPLSDVNRDELPRHIPTLEDLLTFAPHECALSIDVKDISGMAVIPRLIADHDIDARRVWLCFESLADALASRPMSGSMRIVNSARLTRISEGVERRAATLAENGIDALNMPVADWSGGLVTLVHRFGVHAFGWDAQRDDVLRHGLRMGLDALYSDHVDVMVDAYTAEIGHRPLMQ